VTPPPTEGRRDARRLEAFSDGVMAVVITIMVLNLQVPSDTTWRALEHELPSLLVYVLSFALIGTYWNNHHHLLRATEHISAAVMWANLHLLFWLSLIPLATKWVGEAHKASLPASVYGIVSLGAALAYLLLIRMIIGVNGRDSPVARAIGSDVKGKLSAALFAAGIGLAWVSPWVAYAIYVAVVVQWLVPDRRFVRPLSS
jgi:uncharacterized membrane protein